MLRLKSTFDFQAKELKECGNRVFVNGTLEFLLPEVLFISQYQGFSISLKTANLLDMTLLCLKWPLKICKGRHVKKYISHFKFACDLLLSYFDECQKGVNKVLNSDIVGSQSSFHVS